ncbi:MAG: hypothetical protein ABI051_18800 [Vicinamibacterales bacterium]
MRQIALGILVTVMFAASASAQQLVLPARHDALAGVKFSTAALADQATPAAAPAPPPPSKKVTVTLGADAPSAYYFRGYRQESDPGFTFQPFVDVGVAGEHATVNFGAWNSFHTGTLKDAGAGYYETDLYASVTVGMVKALYTAYTYPKIDNSAIHELMLSTTFNDSESAFPLAPSVGIAFELDKSSGLDKGIYLELGVTPAVPMGDDAPVTISIPVKLGFSVKDYYGGDKLGYLSVGALIGVPVNDNFEVHGGVTGYSFPGDFMRAYNGEKGSFVGTVGFTVKF